MSYNKLEFEETFNTLRVFKFQISSSVGNYLIDNNDLQRSGSMLVPESLIIHYDSIGTWSSTPTINLGWNGPSYSDWLVSGGLDLQSRTATNMNTFALTASTPTRAAPTGSPIYLRWNTSTTSQLTASCVLVCYETPVT